jgi:hypothetical protein
MAFDEPDVQESEADFIPLLPEDGDVCGDELATGLPMQAFSWGAQFEMSELPTRRNPR